MRTFETADQALISMLNEILTWGDDITVRGSETKELLHQQFVILQPAKRCVFVPNRNDNIFAKIAETLWVLAGRNDITWLSYYMPRAVDYSDNGITWRGGYGPRLRNADWNKDPLGFIIHTLKEDPFSRRAVINLYDITKDLVPTKDVPCNVAMQFLIRDDQLHLSIFQRSSDIMWGFSGINAFEWSVLLEMMAYWVGVPMGSIVFNITSLHLYDRHYERARKIVEDAGMVSSYQRYISSLPFSTPYEEFDQKLQKIFYMENAVREGVAYQDYDLQDPFLNGCWHMLKAYILWKEFGPGEFEPLVTEILEAMPVCDFRIAAQDFFLRKNTVQAG